MYHWFPFTNELSGILSSALSGPSITFLLIFFAYGEFVALITLHSSKCSPSDSFFVLHTVILLSVIDQNVFGLFFVIEIIFLAEIGNPDLFFQSLVLHISQELLRWRTLQRIHTKTFSTRINALHLSQLTLNLYQKIRSEHLTPPF